MSDLSTVSLTGLGCLSVLGHDCAAHLAAIDCGRTRFAPLAELLGNDSRHAALHAGWIEPRSLLSHRKWSPLTVAALHVARQAITDAAWSADETRDAALFFGSSRGALAGWLAAWPGRRPWRLMAASNSLHSEPAAAISIEFGMTGPWQVIANGCTAGLDALAMGRLWLAAGLARRALVVAADLPLVAPLLDAYAATGILSRDNRNDPFHPANSGILPAESAAAVTLESGTRRGRVILTGCAGNADASDPLGPASDGGRMAALLAEGVARFGPPVALCPHASGTQVQASAEPAAIRRALPEQVGWLPLKPFTGHALGASGLLETLILAAFLQQQRLPPLLSGLYCPQGNSLSTSTAPGPVFKIASALGGRNALAALAPPP